MRLEPSTSSERPLDDHLLDAGLAIARASTGLTCIALPVGPVAAPAIIAAWRSAPMVAWHGDTQYVGVGVARELRGQGPDRFAQVIAAAKQIEISQSVGLRGWVPKLFGGAAFAVGAADEVPWTGFGDAWFALPRWTITQHGGGGWLVLTVDAREAQLDGRWHDELAAFRMAIANGFAARPQPALTKIDAGDTAGFKAYVAAITDAIARGECSKVVSARHAVVTLAGEARPADLFGELDSRHPDTYARLLVRPPNSGTFVGATPERLVRVDGDRVSCDGLAGTIARGEGAEAALLGSAKDRNEHRIVVEAITAALGRFGEVSAADVPGIKTLRHVLHLHTPITAKLRDRHHVLELVDVLHPTPAMGGMPPKVARDWILSREAPRGWYSAPVGWFDLEGNGEFAVAIRSGVIDGEHAYLYAGSGIVAGSDPDRELAETDVKLRPMLGALGVPA